MDKCVEIPLPGLKMIDCSIVFDSMASSRCAATTSKGTPCWNYQLRSGDSLYCNLHRELFDADDVRYAGEPIRARDSGVTSGTSSPHYLNVCCNSSSCLGSLQAPTREEKFEQILSKYLSPDLVNHVVKAMGELSLSAPTPPPKIESVIGKSR